MYVEGGEGLFFMSPEDAKAKLEDLKSADGQKVGRFESVPPHSLCKQPFRISNKR